MDQMGKRIKRLRTNREWTQKQLAEGVCSQSLLSRIEQGIEIPSILIVHNLCQKLGVTVDDLLSYTELASPLITLKQNLFSLYQKNDVEMMYTLLHKKTFTTFEAYREESYYYFFLGVTELYYKKNQKEALANFLKAEAFWKGEDQVFNLLIESYLAAIHAERSEEIKMLTTLNYVLQKLNQITESEQRNINLPTVFLNIATCYAKQDERLTAIEYVNLGIECCKRQNNTFNLTALLFKSGLLFLQMGRKQIGMKRINVAIELSEHVDQPKFTNELIWQKKNWDKICK
ncbi:helix-turn-helix domain-containing protein [Listeria sp. PSOL-1]|uniref:helix-turn-helix domain-containing protein n=1 Tax=Listeria sp. PSOL-1 TaxID=1844999 RepID=UPI0013D42E5C|nr:helix-turn-helix transcriptional regulator [Listeria sp. PSOL-1]